MIEGIAFTLLGAVAIVASASLLYFLLFSVIAPILTWINRPIKNFADRWFGKVHWSDMAMIYCILLIMLFALVGASATVGQAIKNML